MTESLQYDYFIVMITFNAIYNNFFESVRNNYTQFLYKIKLFSYNFNTADTVIGKYSLYFLFIIFSLISANP